SFDLDSDTPTVSVKSADTKNKQGAALALSREIAGLLKPHLEGKMPAARAFNVPDSTLTAAMLRADLADARAAWSEAGGKPDSTFLAEKDDAGRVVLFHSLRHTRGVWLFEHHKASPREVQELMRLSSLSLVDRYTRSFRVTDKSLVERGPDLSPPAEAA